MERFGEYLKSHREKKNIRLEEIASITKIHLRSLEMLESSTWSELPPEPFIRGFIIAYAKYVGLDPKDTLARYFQEAHPSLTLVSEASEPPTATSDPNRGRENAGDLIEKSRAFPTAQVGFAFTALLVVSAVVGLIYVGKRTEPNPDVGRVIVEDASRAPAPVTGPKDGDPRSVASPTDKAPVENTTAPITPSVAAEPAKLSKLESTPIMSGPVPVAEPKNMSGEKSIYSKLAHTDPIPPPVLTAKGSPAPVPSMAPAPKTAPPQEFAHEVTIDSKDRTWIKVVIDETAPVETFLGRASSTTYKAKNKIKVVLGYASGTTVHHNGEVAKGVKLDGTIRTYSFPASAQFPQDKPKRRAAASKPTPEPEPPSSEAEDSELGLPQ